jgi:hypothetical protein
MLTLLGAGQGQNGFDSSYQAVLTYASTLVGATIPTSAQQAVQNKLIVDLKAGGVWNKLDVFYVLATGTNGNNVFSTINWKNPNNFLATLTNPLTFATNSGFTNTGTGSISTNFTPSSQGSSYVRDEAGRFAWIHTAGTSIIDGGSVNAGNRMTFEGSPATQNINNGNSSNAVGVLSGSGLKSINRPASNQIRVYENTNLSISGTTASTGTSTQVQLIFRSAGNYGTHTISIYGMGASLVTAGGDATLNTNLYNAINTYMTNLV